MTRHEKNLRWEKRLLHKKSRRSVRVMVRSENFDDDRFQMDRVMKKRNSQT